MALSRRDFLKRGAASTGRDRPHAGRRRTGAHGRRRQAQVVQGAVPLLRHRLRRDGRRSRTAAWSPRTATPQAEVNRGLNCVKGYFLSKIMYGEDRLTTPLLRMKNGKYDKNGEFAPRVAGTRRSTIMAEKWKRVLKEKGPTAVGMFGSGQWTIWEGYAALKLMQGGLPHQQHRPQRAPLHGVGRGAASCAPSASTSRWAATTTSSTPTPSCCGARTWRRCTRSCGRASPTAASRAPRRQGRRAVDLRAPLLRARRPRAHLHAADRPRDPQLHRQLHHPDQPREPGLRRRSTRRSSSATTTSATGCGPSTRCRRRRRTPATRTARKPITFDEYAKFVADLRRSSTRAKLSGVPKARLDALAELYADPKIKVMSFWTMGFNQHTRGVWANHLVYNLHLLTGKISDARQQPVLAHRPALGLRHGARGRHVLAPPAGRHGGDQPEAPRARPRRSGSCPRARSPTSPATTPCCRTGC